MLHSSQEQGESHNLNVSQENPLHHEIDIKSCPPIAIDTVPDHLRKQYNCKPVKKDNTSDDKNLQSPLMSRKKASHNRMQGWTDFRTVVAALKNNLDDDKK